jgi:hypothetical protein
MDSPTPVSLLTGTLALLPIALQHKRSGQAVPGHPGTIIGSLVTSCDPLARTLQRGSTAMAAGVLAKTTGVFGDTRRITDGDASGLQIVLAPESV